MQQIFLGLNIDHVATIRQARGTNYPDPVKAALDAEMAGADSITLHLREDRRHIQDRDLKHISQLRQTKVNLEMAATPEMIDIAIKYSPEDICIVPEKRQELTTEGGLNVTQQIDWLTDLCSTFKNTKSKISLFIEADLKQIEAAKKVGADVIELHTGTYSELKNTTAITQEIQRLKTAASYAKKLGLQVNAGHGLHYHNVQTIAAITDITELNIGHSIIAQAIFHGLPKAVTDMKDLMLSSRKMAIK